jgi:hypothetical protein
MGKLKDKMQTAGRIEIGALAIVYAGIKLRLPLSADMELTASCCAPLISNVTWILIYNLLLDMTLEGCSLKRGGPPALLINIFGPCWIGRAAGSATKVNRRPNSFAVGLRATSSSLQRLEELFLCCVLLAGVCEHYCSSAACGRTIRQEDL